MKYEQEHQWVIKEVQRENELVSSLYLEAVGERPGFVAGQYLTVRLPDLGPAEGKAYSISSAPHESLVRLTVKQIGEFSRAILSLRPGEIVTTSAPYGFFYPEPDEQTPLVCIVGGIGITPCLSIASHLAHVGDTRPLYLLYSNQTAADITFLDELTTLSDVCDPFTVTHFITRETPKDSNHRSGRITIDAIKEIVPEYLTAEYFICGSMDFTRSVWKTLHQARVPQYQLYTEGFF